jgi:hypothetical protein
MQFFVYLFVLLVAASSVLLGLDWMQAPLQAPVRTQSATLTANTVQPAAAAAPDVTEAQPTAASPAPLAGAPVELTAGSSPADTLKSDATEVKAAAMCDVDACERAYRTFTAADCTYKPSWGPRRLCTKGNPPRRPSAQNAAKEANAKSACNVSACESAYQSFDAATCTYLSTSGVRRLCTR